MHVSFYINFAQANVKYFEDELSERAIFDADGNMRCSYFGNKSNKFANMCPSSKAWQNYILKTVERLTDVYGADGIYFDVFACGTEPCFNPRHTHAPDDKISGKLEVLRAVREQYLKKHGKPIMLMGEWTLDLLGGEMSYQLNQLYWNAVCGGFSPMLLYTFPEFGVVDMIYPKYQTMRAPHVSRNSELFMAEHFTSGCYFWVYDLVDVNTFKKDEHGFALLKELIALKKQWLSLAPNARFSDTVGLSYTARGLLLRRFVLEDGGSLLAGFNLGKSGVFDDSVEGGDGGYAYLEGVTSAYAITLGGNKLELTVKNGKIALPNAKAFIVIAK